MKITFLTLSVLVFFCTFPAQTFGVDFTVTRNDDRNAFCISGVDCSLREAVKAANVSASGDTINFASDLTRITLTDEIIINKVQTLTINGTGANVLTIDGGAGQNRIFYTNLATVIISGVTLTGGNGTTDPRIARYFSDNGGAILVSGGSLTLDRVHVSGNGAFDYGGGIMFDSGTHRIINSTISANSAGGCGGFLNWGGALTVVNSTVSNNTTTDPLDGAGGGFCNEGGDTTLRNVTIANNEAFSYVGGGGIANYGSLNFGNTIVAGNLGYFAPEILTGGGVTSAGYNLVGDSTGDSNSANIAYQLTDVQNTNPLLGALQNNGGATPTHALLAGSPAIDKGLNSLAVDPFNNSILQTDQRGLARISDADGNGTATVDIGAYELTKVKTRSRIRIF